MWEKKDYVGEIDQCNFLSEDVEQKQQLVKDAFDKALGEGHNLTLNVYYGHEEDTASFCLVIESTEKNEYRMKLDGFQGVSYSGPIEATLQNKNQTDVLVQKACNFFGLKALRTPVWMMVTTCKCYP